MLSLLGNRLYIAPHIQTYLLSLNSPWDFELGQWDNDVTVTRPRF